MIIFFSSNIYALNLTIYCKGEETILFEPDNETGEWIKKYHDNSSDYVFIVDDFYIKYGSLKLVREEKDNTYFYGSSMEIHGIGTFNVSFSGESIFIDRTTGEGGYSIHGFFGGSGNAQGQHSQNHHSDENEHQGMDKCVTTVPERREPWRKQVASHPTDQHRPQPGQRQQQHHGAKLAQEIIESSDSLGGVDDNRATGKIWGNEARHGEAECNDGNG